MSKQAKYMTSKFDGTCSACQRDVQAGEPILWLSRGRIECSDCYGASEPVTPPNAQSSAWDAAMSWDDDAPAPGASISTASNAPAMPRQAPQPTPPAPSTPSNVTPLRASVAPEARDTLRADVLQSELDATARDLLTVVVNMVSNAHDTTALCNYCAEQAESTASPTRQRVWQALASACAR